MTGDNVTELFPGLKEMPMVFPPESELLTRNEYMLGNQNGKGYVPTQAEREQRRQTMLGVKHTAERRKRQSLAKIGVKHSPERCANMSKMQMGKHWYNNGIDNKFCFECPEGFTPGMLRRK